ncbi:MAG: hypothetical protein ACJAQ6_000267 [Arenicella sp.]|jgi:hypothetical protein
MGTSPRNLGLALTAALALHAFLLAQTVVIAAYTKADEKPLTVTLLAAPKKAKTPEPAPLESNTKEIAKPVLQPRKIIAIKPKQVIVATKPSDPKILVHISPSRASFQRWLKSETGQFSQESPSSVAEFEQTFDAPSLYKSPTELSPYKGNPAVRGRTGFATEYKGRRTCYVKILNLTDISASPSFTSEDCTLEKKFDLKLNQPNNG